MTISLTFSPDPLDVRAARRFVSRVLSQHGYDTEIVDRAVAGVSELATNVVLHARTAFEVRIRESEDQLRVQVVDSNPRLPRMAPHSPEVTSGRGLRLVRRAG